MSGSSIVIVICIPIIIAAFAIEHHLKKKNIIPEFQRKGPLFSSAERSFFNVLEKAVGREGRVFGMVRVADVLETKLDPNSKKWPFTFDWINQSHFDFVICDPETMTPFCAIALNDDSVLQKYWQDRVELLENACASADFPLIRLPWNHDYSTTEIRALLSPHFSSSEIPQFVEAEHTDPVRPADYAEELP